MALGLATIFSLSLSAQRPGGRPQGVSAGRPSGPPLGVTANGPSDPSQRYEFMAIFLDLSDPQKEQVKAIFGAVSADAEVQRSEMEEKQDALQEAIKANSSAFDLEQFGAEIGTLHGKMVAAQAKVRAQFYAILTPEQKDKLAAMEAMRGGAGRGAGRGAGGRP